MLTEAQRLMESSSPCDMFNKVDDMTVVFPSCIHPGFSVSVFHSVEPQKQQIGGVFPIVLNFVSPYYKYCVSSHRLKDPKKYSSGDGS